MVGEAFFRSLRELPLLPVLRSASGDEACVVAERLIGAGLRVIEFTTTTAGWEEALGAARKQWPAVQSGMGTVTTPADAERALAAGAAFLVTPFPAPEVRQVAFQGGVPLLEGAFAPSEVADVASRGAVKLFPAHVGGPAYLRSLSAVLPAAQIVPTGGIRLEDVRLWLAAGAVAVGVGSDLTARSDVAECIRRALPTEQDASNK